MADKKYDNIINLPHHVSDRHPPLPRESYAAQFSPFAALTGYDGMIDETERFTEERDEQEESFMQELDVRLGTVRAELERGVFPEIYVKYFKKDPLKEGGSYVDFRGRVKKIDYGKRFIVFDDGTVINAQDIADIVIGG